MSHMKIAAKINKTFYLPKLKFKIMKNLINLHQNVDKLGFPTLYHVVRFDKESEQFVSISSFVFSSYDEALDELKSWKSFKNGSYFVQELSLMLR